MFMYETSGFPSGESGEQETNAKEFAPCFPCFLFLIFSHSGCTGLLPLTEETELAFWVLSSGG